MSLISRVKTWGAEVLTASDLNNEFNNILNNLKSQNIEGASATLAQMQTLADPGESGSESLASNVQGEIYRLRNVLKEVTGETYWYESPGTTIAALKAGTGLDDGAITVAKLADNSVSQAKMLNDSVGTNEIINDAVTSAKIADGAVLTALIADSNVTEAKLASGAVVDVKIADDAEISGSKIEIDSFNDTSFTTVSNQSAADDYVVLSDTFNSSQGDGSRLMIAEVYSNSSTAEAGINITHTAAGGGTTGILKIGGYEKKLFRVDGSGTTAVYVSDMWGTVGIHTGSGASQTVQLILRFNGTGNITAVSLNSISLRGICR